MASERGQRSGIMLAMPFELERLSGSSRKAWNAWPVVVQPKLDGERCRAIFSPEGSVSLLSSQCNPIVSVPHILAALYDLGLRGVELDGELYCHGMPFEQLHSIVSRKSLDTLHDCFEDIEYHVFDIVDLEVPQLLREEHRLELAHSFEQPTISYVPSTLCDSPEAVLNQLVEALHNNYEGIIVRHPYASYKRSRATTMMKYKPKREDAYRVVGWEEEISKDGKPKRSLGALVVVGDDNTVFNVGTGFTREQRESLWSVRQGLIGQWIIVAYQNLTEARVPRFPVFMRLELSQKEPSL